MSAVEQAIKRASITSIEQGDIRVFATRAHNDRIVLAREVDRLQAALTTPEIYAGVISEAMEKHLDEVMSQNGRLRAIVNALPKCWRLEPLQCDDCDGLCSTCYTNGELVQDVPVVPGMRYYTIFEDEVIWTTAWDFFFCDRDNVWYVWCFGRAIRVADCYDSPEAAEHAKVKGDG